MGLYKIVLANGTYKEFDSTSELIEFANTISNQEAYGGILESCFETYQEFDSEIKSYLRDKKIDEII